MATATGTELLNREPIPAHLQNKQMNKQTANLHPIRNKEQHHIIKNIPQSVKNPNPTQYQGNPCVQFIALPRRKVRTEKKLGEEVTTSITTTIPVAGQCNGPVTTVLLTSPLNQFFCVLGHWTVWSPSRGTNFTTNKYAMISH